MTDQEKLAEWIDSAVIAESICNQLRAWGITPNLENAKRVWNNVLETELCYALEASVQGIVEREEVEANARS